MFDIVVKMHGLEGFATEYRRSREIQVGATKFRVLPLERVIASKPAANRPKDRAVLPVLESVLRTIKEARPPAYAVSGRKVVRAKPK